MGRESLAVIMPLPARAPTRCGQFASNVDAHVRNRFAASTLAAFWRVKPVAGMLLIPYLLWVTFAEALNYALWQLNPGLLG